MQNKLITTFFQLERKSLPTIGVGHIMKEHMGLERLWPPSLENIFCCENNSLYSSLLCILFMNSSLCNSHPLSLWLFRLHLLKCIFKSVNSNNKSLKVVFWKKKGVLRSLVIMGSKQKFFTEVLVSYTFYDI